MNPDKSRTVVKICGITTLDDAVAAIDAGADMLGFNFYPTSPRYIDPDTCRRIIHALSQRHLEAEMVGVFVNADVKFIQVVLTYCEMDLAQLSGDEPEAILNSLENKGYKALRAEDSRQLHIAQARYPARQYPPAYLIDSYRPGEYGGTGVTADWSLAAELSHAYPILLAGGLTPDNVARAVAQANPWGVDVASGVESSPGIKDHIKLRAFIKNAHGER